MNGDEKLPSEHFWDTEEAEKKYYGVGQSIVEAEEKLTEAQSRLLSVQAVYERFAGGASAVVRRYYSDTEESVLHNLNHTLNPYWLPSDGQVESDKPFNPGRGTLIVQKVESETVQAGIIFGRMRKGYHRDYRIRYSYEKRVEWYTP